VNASADDTRSRGPNGNGRRNGDGRGLFGPSSTVKPSASYRQDDGDTPSSFCFAVIRGGSITDRPDAPLSVSRRNTFIAVTYFGDGDRPGQQIPEGFVRVTLPLVFEIFDILRFITTRFGK